MMKEMSIDKEIEVENLRMNAIKEALLLRLNQTKLDSKVD